MTVLATPAPPDDADAPWRDRTLWGRTLNFCRRKPLGAIGLAIVLVFAFAGAFAELIAPFDPEENDFNSMMVAPGLAHLLGTDQFGRDIFSRLVFGARTAMIVGFGAAVGGGLIGLVLGVTSAYFGGWFDLVLQRIFDILMAFPLIILALAVVSVFGTGVFNVVLAITIPLVPRCGRVVRASALAVREIPYVDAARALGFGHARIVLCHMLPNVLAPFLILLSAFVGQAILAEASLSFLGLGVQEPVAAWGLMLQGSAEEYATTAPWIAIFPGLAIVFTVLGASLFGDALRDAIDPKLRDR
jgi:peptide/nickel transport system permease protein